LKAILDLVEISYKLEAIAKVFYFCLARLVVSLNLEALIGIKVNISSVIGCPVFVFNIDLV
jgi:hypothetical protein